MQSGGCNTTLLLFGFSVHSPPQKKLPRLGDSLVVMASQCLGDEDGSPGWGRGLTFTTDPWLGKMSFLHRGNFMSGGNKVPL